MVKNILASIFTTVLVSFLMIGMLSSDKGLGGAVETVRKTFGQGFQTDANAQQSVVNDIEITKSPDGFVLWDDFTVGTTSPVRSFLTNTTGSKLMCDSRTLSVYSDATAAFAPSFKFAIGTTTTARPNTIPSSLGYSATLAASTTVATTTDTVNGFAGWAFLLNNTESVTLSVGDYSAAIASSTYYGNWAGQVSLHCWVLGE